MGEISDKTAFQAEMFGNRLKKRLNHLSKWAKRTGNDAFRLYDRDIPEVPLVLDKYGDAVSGALYQRPYEKDPAEEAAWVAAMRAAAAKALGLNETHIIIKQRERQRGDAQYEKIAARGLSRIVREDGLKFKVNLSDYLDTGLFLDGRALRRLVGADASTGGKRVLNLFCYTGSFSVHAAAASGDALAGGDTAGASSTDSTVSTGSAVSTDSVDLSNTYLNWAQENFSLNGIETKLLRLEEFTARKEDICPHRLIRADVYAFLEKAAAARLRWDSIILDPPAFSNSTMARADFDLKRDYAPMLAACLDLLAHGGKLWFSAAARSFKASSAEMQTLLAVRFPGVTVTGISEKIIDEDFKGKKVPKSFVIER